MKKDDSIKRVAKQAHTHAKRALHHTKAAVHHTKTRWQRFRKWASHHTVVLTWLGISAGLILLGALFIWISLLRIPTIESFEQRKLINSTKIYDRNGLLLYDIGQEVRRTSVESDKISDTVKQAAIAIEDQEFYNHYGIRPSSILRAILANLLPGGNTQGGSTITQQVVKNTILTQDRSLSRKLKEWVLSVKIERLYTKDQILTMYLNEAPYGGAMYGVEQASQAFFGINASEVSLAQAAYLAAIPNAPSYFSPYGKNKEKLESRKNLVLSEMESLGMITEEEAAAAKAEVVTFRPQADTKAKALHFVEYIKQQLEEKYGPEVLISGGLHVTTTLDWELQQAAEKIVSEQALKNEKEWNATNQALIALDPTTGQIISMVGSRGYSDTNIDGAYNVTLAKRQPGSSFKPIIYSRAFELGYTPDTKLFDVRTQFSGSCGAFEFTSVQPCYAPENYDGKYEGLISLRSALAESRNIPAVKLLYLVSTKQALQTAMRLGITSLDDNDDRYGLTLVLGGGEVSLLEMASAYGVFANDGTRLPPTGILKIEDGTGKIFEEYQARPIAAMDPQATRLLNSVLSDNVARTPLFGARSFLYFGDRQVAAKTGTTNDNKDAWLIGYTPNLVVGVWSGNNDNKPMKKGSAISGPAWRAYMDLALAKLPNVPFPTPDPIDQTTKPVLRGLWYGGESVWIDTISGKRATELTPPETRKELVIPAPHSILHWVLPGDPKGPIPDNPSRDQQYRLWEPVEQAYIQSRGGVPGMPTIPSGYDDVHTEQNQPQVSLDVPPTISSGSSVTVSASVSSNYETRSVEFYANGTYIGESSQAPYSVTFTPSDLGLTGPQLLIRAIATDTVYNHATRDATITMNP